MKKAQILPTPAEQLAELESTTLTLQAERAVIVTQILKAEKAGEHTGIAKQPNQKVRAQGRLRLNGVAAHHLVTTQARRSYQELVDELAVLDSALDEGGRLHAKLSAEAAAARYEQRKDELAEAMRQIALSLIGLERCLQARDEIIRAIRLPGLSEGGWPLCGRLRNTASPIYRYLETGVKEKWLTQKEFDTEFNRARCAAGE